MKRAFNNILLCKSDEVVLLCFATGKFCITNFSAFMLFRKTFFQCVYGSFSSTFNAITFKHIFCSEVLGLKPFKHHKSMMLTSPLLSSSFTPEGGLRLLPQGKCLRILFNLLEIFCSSSRKSSVKRCSCLSFFFSNLNKQRVILSILTASEFDVFQVKEEIVNSISNICFHSSRGSRSPLKVNGITFK